MENLTLEGFITELGDMFDYPEYVGNVAGRLLSLKQAVWGVADYSADFKILVAGCSWKEEALCDIFIKELIDYWVLNAMTIKNKYSLPLVASAFESCQGAS